MIRSEIHGLRIAGIAATVPIEHVDNHTYDELFGYDVVEKNIATTGIKGSYHANCRQTSSDLGFAAAERLLQAMNVDKEDIGVLIFAAAYLDYQVPPTACVLHKRLGLATDCIAFDINLACSGYVYGLQALCSTLVSTNAKKGLLITGDITSKVISPLDKSRMLFGDAGSATLVEKSDKADEQMRFGMKTDGSRFKSIIVPAGLHRMPEASHERTLREDGNIRSNYDLYMNGTEVFSFTMTDVPKLAKEFMAHYQLSPDDFDAFVFHQPNLFILKHLAKKIGISQDKMPISLDRYGNTSVCSIPITICDQYSNKTPCQRELFLYGFGVGLSWGCAAISLGEEAVILPIANTDDNYTEGNII